MIDMDETTMAALAREIAMAIRDHEVIFAEYEISPEDYYEISKIDFFRRAKEHFALQWNSAMSSAERARLIAAAYSEQMLPMVTKRSMRETEPLAACIEGLKLVSKIAGLGEGQAEAPKSDRFTITINLGADQEVYDKSIAVDPNDTPKLIEAKAEEAVVTLPEGKRRGRPPGSKNKPKQEI